MFIFISKTRRYYIAGIFQGAAIGDFSDALNYIRAAPFSDEKWTLHRLPLTYPFFIAEYVTGSGAALKSTFSFHQNELDATGGDIVYTIEGNYVPEVPWNDEMGNLPHEHLSDMDEDEIVHLADPPPVADTDEDDLLEFPP